MDDNQLADVVHRALNVIETHNEPHKLGAAFAVPAWLVSILEASIQRFGPQLLEQLAAWLQSHQAAIAPASTPPTGA